MHKVGHSSEKGNSVLVEYCRDSATETPYYRSLAIHGDCNGQSKNLVSCHIRETEEQAMNTTSDNHEAESQAEAGHEEATRTGVNRQSPWLRLLYMLITMFLYAVSRVVIAAVVILQFFWVLFTEKPNDSLTTLGQSLATYTYQIIRFLTYTSDEKPFPFVREWPNGPPQ